MLKPGGILMARLKYIVIDIAWRKDIAVDRRRLVLCEKSKNVPSHADSRDLTCFPAFGTRFRLKQAIPQRSARFPSTSDSSGFPEMINMHSSPLDLSYIT